MDRGTSGDAAKHQALDPFLGPRQADIHPPLATSHAVGLPEHSSGRQYEILELGVGLKSVESSYLAPPWPSVLPPTLNNVPLPLPLQKSEPCSTFVLHPKPYIKQQNKQNPSTRPTSPYIKSDSTSIVHLPNGPPHIQQANTSDPSPPALSICPDIHSITIIQRPFSATKSATPAYTSPSGPSSCPNIILPKRRPVPPSQPSTCSTHILRPKTRCSALAPVRPKTVTAALHPPPPPTPLPSQCSRLCLPEDSHRGLPFPSLPSTSTTKTTKEMGLDQSGRTRESHSFASAPKSPTDFVPAGHCLFFFQVFLVPKVPRRPPSTPLERFLF